ncbi:peptide-binding protein [Burkholderia multivorans]|uniref:peptide-binding protein n=1 Tax=Burkholderia multivorans TaxID=87883 RepID=UPI000DAD7936|nr:peptide-binding protein [Burkholderia multivorans]MBR7899368.1 peptide-binding protein [Burkholderia multivorans]RAA23005.1 peptide-binding protein [Burkholderia multivorans]RAA28173.1 peptide-binding protein [Burkholderia multivorans]RAA33942.1 peptide-binding protein [Burkholderia multivorans]RAA41986.1 peptide-binding protein [Burkholderia multivorans]
MTERVKRNIARWVAGALGALLMPLALAQPPHGSHGFGGGDMHAYGQPAGGAPVWRRAAPLARAPGPGVKAGGSRWGLRPTPSYGHYAAQSPYRPISAEVRQVTRPSGAGNMPLRAGSIRADVARYNEERGGRPMPPPRSQEEPAHSPFFSPFYRN